MSTNIPKYDFKEFVDTLVVALREVEQAVSPIKHIHPVVCCARVRIPRRSPR